MKHLGSIRRIASCMAHLRLLLRSPDYVNQADRIDTEKRFLMQDVIQLEVHFLEKHNAEGNFHKIEMKSASTSIWLDDSTTHRKKTKLLKSYLLLVIDYDFFSLILWDALSRVMRCPYRRYTRKDQER